MISARVRLAGRTNLPASSRSPQGGFLHVRTSTMTARGERVGGEPMSAMIPTERPAHPEAQTPVAGVEPYYPNGRGGTCGEVAATKVVRMTGRTVFFDNYNSSDDR